MMEKFKVTAFAHSKSMRGTLEKGEMGLVKERYGSRYDMTLGGG